MAKVLITEANLSDIADAIRTKNGQSSATYTPAQMAPAILAIPTGGGAPLYKTKLLLQVLHSKLYQQIQAMMG